jgi:archaellum component FlaC
MAFRDYNKLSAKIDELEELRAKIINMKQELKEIKSLAEYNELAEKINVLVEEYNQRREDIKSWI